jgi:hypothetical protein
MAVLVLAEWALTASTPKLAALTLYLLVSGFGPLLGSGFWLIADERFDPHTAKKVFGQIAGAGTLGGLLGGLGAAQLAAIGDVGAMLPLLAGLNLASAWVVRRLAGSPDKARRASDTTAAALVDRSGLRVLAEARYLHNLVALVLLGTIATTLVDQAFKTHVKATFGAGPALGSFFSLYYAALSLITFVIQTGGSRYALEKLGLAVATGTPSLTFIVGGAATLLMPGFRGLLLTRAGGAVLSGSIYRAGYELSYTPIAPHDRRAVKSIIDVGVARTGDIVGATVTQSLLWMPQPGQTTMLLALAMGCAGIGVLVASRLTRGYAEALETSLRSRAVELDLADIHDRTTRTTMLRTMQTSWSSASQRLRSRLDSRPAREPPTADPAIADPDVQQILTLQSGSRQGVLAVLRSERGLSPAVVARVIPLLAWDEVSRDCIRALRSVAEERVGELIDALIDPNQPFAVRRRLARVFSVCVSQRAADGLLLGLEDLRFEVRYQCARSLHSILEKNPGIQLDKARILALVKSEVAVNKAVWDKRQLLDGLDEDDERAVLAEQVPDRASHSLAHVFALLALVLPAEPLRIAFRALQTDDQVLRGTALEYLDSVLPHDIHDRLWPFLEHRRRPDRAHRPREEALADLLRSDESVKARFEELKAARRSAP